MLRSAVRGVVVVAAEVAEVAGKRVVDTATAVLERSGVDVAELERKVAAQFPPSGKSLQTLAGEAFTAGMAGIDLAVGVARSGVEQVFEKVGDQVVKVGVVLSYLESKLREVEEEPPARPEPRAESLFDAGWERTEPQPEQPKPAAPPKATVTKATVTKETAAKAATEKAAPAKKTAPAKKAATAKKTTVAKKTTAAKKTATAKKTSPAKKTTTRKQTPNA